MSSLRLLKVVVQPMFVVDDGTNLTEEAGQVITVNGGEWADFAERFEQDVQQLCQRWEASEDPQE